MENCVFCKIVKGEIPSFKAWEDENFLAFLSIEPINPGHILVVPKQHSDYIFNMDDAELCKLMIACKPLAKALEKAFRPATGKIGVMIAGLGVAHVHIHLIPMEEEGDLTFVRARHDVPPEELKQNAKKIKSFLTIS